MSEPTGSVSNICEKITVEGEPREGVEYELESEAGI